MRISWTRLGLALLAVGCLSAASARAANLDLTNHNPRWILLQTEDTTCTNTTAGPDSAAVPVALSTRTTPPRPTAICPMTIMGLCPMWAPAPPQAEQTPGRLSSTR